ncbi:MAG: transglutaminase-like domain-containing protein, partial [Candidatus Omnitrophota bacterium]|nr:transglutaminase-like domain-containing protein [Candidatus Omnitrophota bacterium]
MIGEPSMYDEERGYWIYDQAKFTILDKREKINEFTLDMETLKNHLSIKDFYLPANPAVFRESASGKEEKPAAPQTESQSYSAAIQPSVFNDCGNPKVISKTEEVIKGAVSEEEKVLKIAQFVRGLKYAIGPWNEKASETLRKGSGICSTLTNLQVAMLRATGITTRIGVRWINRRKMDIDIYKKISPEDQLVVPHMYTEVWLHRKGFEPGWYKCDILDGNPITRQPRLMPKPYMVTSMDATDKQLRQLGLNRGTYITFLEDLVLPEGARVRGIEDKFKLSKEVQLDTSRASASGKSDADETAEGIFELLDDEDMGAVLAFSMYPTLSPEGQSRLTSIISAVNQSLKINLSQDRL